MSNIAKLLFIGMFLVTGCTSNTQDTITQSDPSQAAEELPFTDEDGSATIPDLEGENFTSPQENAIRSAQSYLEFSGFSRQGLIEQLSSEYGDQYELDDATVAVDSLTVDWNEQAAKSAKSYLELSGFSCQELIDQLSSENGDNYTLEQAEYGANAADAC